MPRPNSVWPEIPRLPGERLLQGVPHNRAESVFSEPGMADACDVISATQDLNSAQRRVQLKDFMSRTAFVKNLERSQATLDALGRIADQELTDNTPMALHASFLRSVLSERVVAQSQAEEEATQPEPTEQSPYRESINIEWATALMHTNLGKSSRRENLHKDDVLARTVARLVSVGDSTDPGVIEAGAGLCNRFIDEGTTFQDRISIFGHLTYAIDRVKVKTTGFHATTRVSNMIIQAAGATLAAKVPPEKIGEAVAIVDHLLDVTKRLDPRSRAMIPKYTLVRQNLVLRQYAHNHALKIKPSEKDAAHISAEDLAELKEQTAGVMTNLGRLRKYGLKSSYFGSNLQTESNQAWVFSEPFDDEVVNPILGNYLADIKLCNQEDVQTALTAEYERTEFGGGTKVIGKQIPVYQNLIMMPDGELAISSSFGIITLRNEYEAMGAETEYELMRLGLLTNFIDLVVPKKYTEDLESTTSPRLGFLKRFKKPDQLATIRDLLVPRIKLVESSTDVIEAEIEEEIAESRRQLREHDVIWHIRVLPEGYHANQQAIDEAKRRGIQLKDGETFVKAHTRGNPELGKVNGHKAKKLRENGSRLKGGLQHL